MPRYPVRSPAKSSSEAGGVAAVDRALMLLAAFRAGDRALGLAELAGRTQLVKSTALRLLASLVHFGFIQRRDDGLYALGPEIARLHGTFASGLSLEAIVVPVLQRLMDQTKETASFHVIRGDKRLCLYRVNSTLPLHVHVQVGDLLPLDRGAGGRVLSAYSGAKGTLYEKIRRDGYANLKGDRVADLSGISAPVLGAAGELVGTLTLSFPTHRYREKFVAPVREAARAVSVQLGG